jgi:hypothetical protein
MEQQQEILKKQEEVIKKAEEASKKTTLNIDFSKPQPRL